MEHDVETKVDLLAPNAGPDGGGPDTHKKRRRRRRRRRKFGALDDPLEVDVDVDRSKFGTQACTWRVLLGASLIALVSGFPNAFENIHDGIQHDPNVNSGHRSSDSYLNTLGGIGQAGLFLSLPAGLLAERYSTAAACFAGSILTVLGYVSMSYSNSHVALVFANICAGIGSGSTFLSALQTAIAIGSPIGIGLVSLCMSLSITLAIKVEVLYSDHVCHTTDATLANGCWRRVVRVYAAMIACCCLVGGMLIVGASRYYSHKKPEKTAPHHVSTQSTMFDQVLPWKTALAIFKRPYFLCLSAANLVGLGSGIYAVNAFGSIWDDYRQGELSSGYLNSTIIPLFSYLNAFGNVISPIISDYLHVRGTIRVSRFLALCILLQALTFFALAFMDARFRHIKNRSEAELKFGGFLISFAGFGYGIFLTLFPTSLADAYGRANFGSFLSYIQLGAASLAVLMPLGATAIKERTGSYFTDHMIMGFLLVLGFICMFVPKPPSARFRSQEGMPSAFKTCCKSKQAAHDAEYVVMSDEENSGDWVDTMRTRSASQTGALPEHMLPAPRAREAGEFSPHAV